MAEMLGQDVCFAPCCSLREAGEMRDALVTAFAGSGPVRLNLTKVSSGDVTLVQLLLSARASAAAQGRALSVALSPAVEHLLLRAGLDDRWAARIQADMPSGARP